MEAGKLINEPVFEQAAGPRLLVFAAIPAHQRGREIGVFREAADLC
jgi:hypothetical protein